MGQALPIPLILQNHSWLSGFNDFGKDNLLAFEFKMQLGTAWIGSSECRERNIRHSSSALWLRSNCLLWNVGDLICILERFFVHMYMGTVLWPYLLSNSLNGIWILTLRYHLVVQYGVFPAPFSPARFIKDSSYTKAESCRLNVVELAPNPNPYRRPNVCFENKIIRPTKKGRLWKSSTALSTSLDST